MRADFHVHSDYSDDSWYLMPDVIERAIEIGLDEICFTEHVDYGVKEDWKAEDVYIRGGNKLIKNANYPLYFEEIERLQAKYQPQIAVKVGLEFGMQRHTMAEFQKLYDSYPFDFILLSVHQVGDKEFWTGEFQKGQTEEASYQHYYEELKYLVQHYKDYSCLAHLDLVRRYLDKETDRFLDFQDIITEILEIVIADGKGIEINTSSYRYGVNGLTPSYEILKLYYQLGGRIITIGSDSHQEEHLGAYFDEAKQVLLDIGFTKYCTFTKMKPHFWDL